MGRSQTLSPHGTARALWWSDIPPTPPPTEPCEGAQAWGLLPHSPVTQPRQVKVPPEPQFPCLQNGNSCTDHRAVLREELSWSWSAECRVLHVAGTQ